MLFFQGYILGSTTSAKCQHVKVAWEDDNSVSVVAAAAITDISPKTTFKLGRKMLQAKIVSFLFRLATEMSSLQSAVNWVKLLKSEPIETNRPGTIVFSHKAKKRRETVLAQRDFRARLAHREKLIIFNNFFISIHT